MFGLIPLLSLILLGLSVHLWGGRRDRLLRESVLIGFLLWGGIITALMEILSVFHCLTFQWVLFCWVSVMAVCIFVIGKHRQYLIIPWRMAYELPLIEKVFLFVIFLITAWLAVIAFFAPPNTCDAMTYHMARVVHWIQNHTVAFYPTHTLRQLYSPPGVEYAIFQFQILSKGDQGANCVQYLSMMGSLGCISLIAKELGAGRWGQILSVIIAATIPMGILQATSTQTDYGVTLWLCEFIYFFNRWRKYYSWEYAFWMAMALGLAFLAKGTGMVYAIPFLLWIAGIVLRRISLKKLNQLAMLVIVVMILNSGMYYRNANFFHGNVFTSVRVIGKDSLINEHFSWQAWGGNALRNVGMELSTPWVGTNNKIEQFLYRTSDVLHVNMNDYSSSFQKQPFKLSCLTMHEDAAGSPLQVILFIAAVFLIVFLPSVRNKEIVLYLLALLGMTIVFNLVLKWQPWGQRFHLSFFVLAAPLIGAVFERISYRAMVAFVMAGLIASALPYVFYNPLKSFVTLKNIMQKKGREEEYFPDPLILSKYKKFRDELRNMQCHEVGLLIGEFDKEYPFWVVLNPSSDKSIRLEHIEVADVAPSLKYPSGRFNPCALITVAIDFSSAVGTLEQNTYIKDFSYGKGSDETDIFVRANK